MEANNYNNGIINIDKILNAQPISEPWEHYVVDDVLNYSFDDREEFMNDESLYFQLLGEINHYKHSILEKYKPIRLEKNQELEIPDAEIMTKGRVQFLHTEPNVEKEVHGDRPDKIWTCVVYCFPENNDGTVLNYNDRSVAKKIEWKQNRALIFCPGVRYWNDKQNLHTLHQIVNTTNEPRSAIAINIISSDIRLKHTNKKIWFDFKDNNKNLFN